MKSLFHIACSLTVLSGIVGASALAEEPTKTKGMISIGVQEVTMREGMIYLVKVEGDGFRPNVQMDPGSLRPLDQGFNDRKPFEGYHFAERSQSHTLYIIPDLFSLRGKKGPFEYTLTVTPVKLAEKALLNKEDSLTNNDPAYKNQFYSHKNHKAAPLKLTASQFYVIDMKRRGANQLDCYLLLEDEDGKVVANNDDGGEGLDSRIVFNPQKTGNHRIITTNLGSNVGDFTLTVRTQQKD